MSIILKALRKIQVSRQDHQDPKIADIVYLTDAPQAWSKTALMIIPVIGAIVAILINISAILLIRTKLESKQVKMLILQRTINIQERKIGEMITLFNAAKNNSDSQIRDLEFRFKKETQNMKVRIDRMALTCKDINECALSNRF